MNKKQWLRRKLQTILTRVVRTFAKIKSLTKQKNFQRNDRKQRQRKLQSAERRRVFEIDARKRENRKNNAREILDQTSRALSEDRPNEYFSLCSLSYSGFVLDLLDFQAFMRTGQSGYILNKYTIYLRYNNLSKQIYLHLYIVIKAFCIKLFITNSQNIMYRQKPIMKITLLYTFYF